MTTALYRRYRPDTFADVIGQDHVTSPLVTALSKDAVSHAYLFSGPRGCGKTTSARILARCLNCAAGPTGTPCGECESCRDLATGGPGSLDVIEIDAASHGGVDDARDLRERATFAPVRDRYKIFIIDEAHMVTQAGFNALLKIVEEPPEHIKFIFATTEPDKVIGTIRSRTHHYPFRLVPPEPLLEYLERLCTAEGVHAAPGVLQLVLRAGGGSVRDTLSVLDQLIAGSGESGIDYDRAVALLGFTHASLLDEVVEAVTTLNGEAAFGAVDRVVQSGQDPRRFVEDLLERLRDLIIVKSAPENPQAILRGVPESQIRTMTAQAEKLGHAELSRAADTTATALTEMAGATSPRLHLELLMARLLLPHAEQGHNSLAARLERLERRMDFTTGAGVTPRQEPPSPQPDPAPQQQATTASDDGWATPGVTRSEPESAPSQPAQPQPAQPETSPPASPQPVSSQSVSPAAEPPQAEPPQTEGPQTQAPQPQAPQESAPAVQTPAPGDGGDSGGGDSVQMMQQAWPDIIEALKPRSRLLWMLVKDNVRVAGFDGKVLRISFAHEGPQNSFANRGGDEALAAAVQDVLGMQVRIEPAAGPGSAPGGEQPPKAEGREDPASSDPETSTPPVSAPETSIPGTSIPETSTPETSPSETSTQEASGPANPPGEPPPEELSPPEPAPDTPGAAPAEASPRADEDHKPVVPIFARRAGNSPATGAPAATAPGAQRPAPSEHSPAAAAIRQRLSARHQSPAEPPPIESEETVPPPDWAEAPAPAAEDEAHADDVEIAHSGLFGRRAIERILDGTLIEERSLDDDTP
ncbi:DNA polymerase III subunit gamma and tau [Nesterenkonia alba]|uniref:DNA polymerase III subunit gamma and tau n=1 Tax=Nesterenkonia alba TaxID=515814 RepID=UPI00040E46C0|nr:DNA polymerase III subunit gamma and tau [Nesterenkonia alba]